MRCRRASEATASESRANQPSADGVNVLMPWREVGWAGEDAISRLTLPPWAPLRCGRVRLGAAGLGGIETERDGSRPSETDRDGSRPLVSCNRWLRPSDQCLGHPRLRKALGESSGRSFCSKSWGEEEALFPSSFASPPYLRMRVGTKSASEDAG